MPSPIRDGPCAPCPPPAPRTTFVVISRAVMSRCDADSHQSRPELVDRRGLRTGPRHQQREDRIMLDTHPPRGRPTPQRALQPGTGNRSSSHLRSTSPPAGFNGGTNERCECNGANAAPMRSASRGPDRILARAPSVLLRRRGLGRGSARMAPVTTRPAGRGARRESGSDRRQKRPPDQWRQGDC